MAASNYSGTSTEQEEHAHLRAIEERHIDLEPEGEREEIRQIFESKGFDGADLERVVQVITADRRRWVDTMLAEEYGLAKVVRSPLQAALVTFAAFVICGAVPLLPFLLDLERSFAWSVALTALVFFLIGSTKARWSPVAWWRSGAQTLAIGLVAAAIAFAIGHALRTLV
jgi:VIT1/CCC1 family predicted Fe2+/Mn2+ transporter